MGYKPEGLNPRPFPGVKFGLQLRYILDFNIFQKYSICKHIYLFFVFRMGLFSYSSAVCNFNKGVFDCNKMLISIYIRFAVYKSIKILAKSEIP